MKEGAVLLAVWITLMIAFILAFIVPSHAAIIPTLNYDEYDRLPAVVVCCSGGECHDCSKESDRPTWQYTECCYWGPDVGYFTGHCAPSDISLTVDTDGFRRASSGCGL